MKVHSIYKSMDHGSCTFCITSSRRKGYISCYKRMMNTNPLGHSILYLMLIHPYSMSDKVYSNE